MTACFGTTKHEGQVLRKDVDRIDKKLSDQDSEVENRLAEIKTTLEQATKLLTRSSADTGNEVTGIREEQSRLNGMAMETKRRLDDMRTQLEQQDVRLATLEQKLTAIEAKLGLSGAVSGESPETLYKDGLAAMAGSDFEKAKNLFKNLVVKFPSDERADDAQMQRGEANVKLRNYQDALAEFQKVFEKYPQSPLADNALFRAGEAAEALKWCTDARAYYGLLRQKYPSSELVKKAKDKDGTLKKSANDKAKCQS